MIRLLALAVAPGLAISLFVYLRDKYEREPLYLLAICFFMGMVSCYPAMVLEGFGEGIINTYLKPDSTLYNLVLAFPIVGFSEELSKFIMVFLFAYRNKNMDEPFDGIVYAVMVSMGFATLENIMYVSHGGVSTGITRMFTAVPAHAANGVMMGYFLGLAKFRKQRNVFFFFNALLWPVMFHGAYDYSLFDSVNYPLAVLGALVSLLVSLRFSFKAMAWHVNASPFKDGVV